MEINRDSNLQSRFSRIETITLTRHLRWAGSDLLTVVSQTTIIKTTTTSVGLLLEA